MGTLQRAIREDAFHGRRKSMNLCLHKILVELVILSTVKFPMPPLSIRCLLYSILRVACSRSQLPHDKGLLYTQ